jgi:hypothetical protein
VRAVWFLLAGLLWGSAALGQDVSVNVAPAIPLTGTSGNLPTFGAGGTLGDSGLNQIIITASPYNASVGASDNATAIQSAINAAVAAGVPLVIPASPSGGCYKYTAPLTIAGNLTIRGTHVAENWAGGINVPLGSPPLLGSVLCPASNGSDAIDITSASTEVNISDFGILFQTPLSGTGDGIHYVPALNVQGLSGSVWKNVKVYGHDGNHYGVNLTNPLLDTFISVSTYGGGVFNLYGNSTTSGDYGNCTFVQPYGQVIVGGSANGFNMDASSASRLNLLTFIRPQAITDWVTGVTPGGNPPTSAQSIWVQKPNVTAVRVIGGDLETNVGSSITVTTGVNSDLDWAGTFTDAVNINAPAWTTNGILYSPQTRTITDTTSSGTVAIQAMFAMPGTHLNATNATTYTNFATLYVGAPIAGVNASFTRTQSIYTAGEIATAADYFGTGGAFLSGTIWLNKSGGTATTDVGSGTTTGLVTIGGASNIVQMGPGTKLTQFVVSGLPTCNAGAKGQVAEVTDALAPTYLGLLTGGGAIFAPVTCNGTAWVSF